MLQWPTHARGDQHDKRVKPIGHGSWYTRLSATRLARALWLAIVIAIPTAGVAQTTAAVDATARRLEVAPKLQLIQELERGGWTTSVTWSSNGSKLAAYTVPTHSAGGKVITVWVSDGRVFREIKEQDLFFHGDDALAFVAGDRQLVTTPWLSSSTLGFLVVDIASGNVLREVPGPRADGADADNRASRFVASPDGSILAVVFGLTRKQAVRLYSTQDWNEIATIEETATDVPSQLAFSADGRILAIREFMGGKILIYDLAAKRVTQTITDPVAVQAIVEVAKRAKSVDVRYPARTMALNSDGALVAVGPLVGAGRATEATNDAPVRVLRATDGSTVASFPGPSPPLSGLAWSPDGRFIAFVTGYQKLHLWNPLQPPASEQVAELDGHPDSVAFSPDATKLAVNYGNKIAIFGIAR